MSSIRNAVYAEMQNQGLGQHTAKADPVITALEEDRDANPTVVIADFVRRNRYSRSVSANQINAIAAAVTQAREDDLPISGKVLDAAGVNIAVDVIRAFITSGSKHLTKVGRRGASEDEVTALLQIAGLEDAPAEVEEDTVDPGLFARLVEFARSKGFRG